MELRVRNVNQAVGEALWLMKTSAVEESSRNGPVLVLPEPLMITYTHPTERILFWPERDANVFFHIMECLWMMSGRNDVDFVRYFNGKMGDYSDDGKTFNGAYGYRWRNRFGFDQIKAIIEHLKETPNSRRAVLGMWSPQHDLENLKSKDVPCNTQAYFDLRGGVLNMTVTNRSNDLMWGMLGANAVHFSFLQEFIAGALGVPVGVYRQFSNNVHLYTELYDFKKHLDVPPATSEWDYYTQRRVVPHPILRPSERWDEWLIDCARFCDFPFEKSAEYRCVYFNHVAQPIARSYFERKNKDYDKAKFWATQIAAVDIRRAALEWIERREHAQAN